jgi:hypothetical protein
MRPSNCTMATDYFDTRLSRIPPLYPRLDIAGVF